jgi:hypothetical protein
MNDSARHKKTRPSRRSPSFAGSLPPYCDRTRVCTLGVGCGEDYQDIVALMVREFLVERKERDG